MGLLLNRRGHTSTLRRICMSRNTQKNVDTERSYRDISRETRWNRRYPGVRCLVRELVSDVDSICPSTSQTEPTWGRMEAGPGERRCQRMVGAEDRVAVGPLDGQLAQRPLANGEGQRIGRGL